LWWQRPRSRLLYLRASTRIPQKAIWGAFWKLNEEIGEGFPLT
jgi:hypothetical protein